MRRSARAAVLRGPTAKPTPAQADERPVPPAIVTPTDFHPVREVFAAVRRIVLGVGLGVVGLVGIGLIDFGHRCGCRRNANESAAIATLKNLASAQAQLQEAGAIDVDGDGRGEYGWLAELAGAVPLRAAPSQESIRLRPPLVSAAFAAVKDGGVRRSGYVFAVFLPGVGGTWLGEAARGGGEGGGGNGGGGEGRHVDADAAEHRWLAYAWPQVPGASGKRVFCRDENGCLWAASAVGAGAVTGADLVPGRSGFVDTSWFRGDELGFDALGVLWQHVE